MRDRDLYARILGLEKPWTVTGVELALKEEEVRVLVEFKSSARLPCPECGRPCGGYDTRRRRWRHLDTCQLKTIVEAAVPRVKCSEHGVRQIRVPWAESRSGFTSIKATKIHVPEAEKKIAFDKFHVAALLSKAVDKVRRGEHKELRQTGDDTLAGTRYLWLKHPDHIRDEIWDGQFAALRESSLRTARAWAIKEMGMGLWGYVTRAWAKKAWKKWLGWALRCRLEPVQKAARTIREHLWGILNAICLRATNAIAESVNAKIQRVKRMACGFRNRERFRRAIYFHLGGLDLYPALADASHTDS